MIIVIGGGPAGMMAAISAASAGGNVILAEKNPSTGRKLLLTGGGRCNITNACAPEDLTDHFTGTGDFLRNAFKLFDNAELLSFFSEGGLLTKTEDHGRIFPVTDKASSVLAVLDSEMEKQKVKVLRDTRVNEVLLDGDRVKGVQCDNGRVLAAERVIIATGGLSYEITGSTGDGMEMARRAGHHIVPARPGLVSLNVAQSATAALEGLTIDKAVLTSRADKKRAVSGPDGLLFTRTGISGPVTLSASAKVVDWLSEGEKVSVEIDLLPDMSREELDAELVRLFSTSPSRDAKNALRGLVPARLAGFLADAYDIPSNKRTDQITGEERKKLLSGLKALCFEICRDVSIKKAQITRGGVAVKEIDPRTMGSKKISGLYFAGETIDVDGDCGGFNLQAAFSTGYLAGLSAARDEKEKL